MNKQFFILRTAILLTVLFAVNLIIPLQTSLWFLSVAAGVGVYLSTQSIFNKETGLASILRLLAICGVGYGISTILGEFPFSRGSFFLTGISFHIAAAAMVCTLAYVTSWLITKVRFYFPFESTIIGVAGLLLFAKHREFRFDRLEIVSELSWQFGISPTAILTILGSISTLVFLAYLALTPRIFDRSINVVKSRGSSFSLFSATSGVIVVALLAFSAFGVYKYYSEIALKRLMNGVGLSTSSEGVSPLDFNSALGGTNQPAAVVRLEGDYKNNPYSPVLFFREAALSEFNGKELVQAGHEYDTDNPKTLEPFTSDSTVGEAHRTSLTQSIFTLIDHKTFLGVDYPVEIRLLKNPNPGRFKSAYRVYSMAPSFTPEQISTDEVGDPNWDEDTWKHYTAEHRDSKYKELAAKVTEGITSPVEKAQALSNYLIKNAIYTLTPGHTVKDDEDPVAPFLFGDMRGYCVHFAHAMVYMLRSLGIPARIGTGYLTDLSQSKDGHILLRLNDRHAWAEVFVRGIGWVVFDVQPEKVENHGVTDVDAKLLEELMGMIGMPEEFSDAKAAKDEPALQPEPSTGRGFSTAGLYTLIAFVLFVIFVKIYLRFSWILPGSIPTKMRRLYRSEASLLVDLGYGREFGETRGSYRNRIKESLSKDILKIVEPLLENLYRGANINRSTPENRVKLELPVSLKIKSLLNLSSVTRWIGGRAW